MKDQPIVLVVSERLRRDGKFTGRWNGRVIVKASKQPFVESARKLLAEGQNPFARYVMRRSADGPDDLVSTLGEAASLTVEEGRRAPFFRAWKPRDSVEGAG